MKDLIIWAMIALCVSHVCIQAWLVITNWASGIKTIHIGAIAAKTKWFIISVGYSLPPDVRYVLKMGHMALVLGLSKARKEKGHVR